MDGVLGLSEEGIDQAKEALEICEWIGREGGRVEPLVNLPGHCVQCWDGQLDAAEEVVGLQ